MVNPRKLIKLKTFVITVIFILGTGVLKICGHMKNHEFRFSCIKGKLIYF